MPVEQRSRNYSPFNMVKLAMFSGRRNHSNRKTSLFDLTKWLFWYFVIEA